MKRRQFLAGLLGLVATPLLPRKKTTTYCIIGRYAGVNAIASGYKPIATASNPISEKLSRMPQFGWHGCEPKGRS